MRDFCDSEAVWTCADVKNLVDQHGDEMSESPLFHWCDFNGDGNVDDEEGL